MEKSSSDTRSEPELDLAEPQVQVQGIDPNQTIGSVHGLAYSRTLVNGFWTRSNCWTGSFWKWRKMYYWNAAFKCKFLCTGLTQSAPKNPFLVVWELWLCGVPMCCMYLVFHWFSFPLVLSALEEEYPLRLCHPTPSNNVKMSSSIVPPNQQSFLTGAARIVPSQRSPPWFGTECNYYKAVVINFLGPYLEDLFNFCKQTFSLKMVLLLANQLVCEIRVSLS